MSDSWNIKICLGNWRGSVQIPKSVIPDAYDANQKVIDLAWDWVNEQQKAILSTACQLCDSVITEVVTSSTIAGVTEMVDDAIVCSKCFDEERGDIYT